MATFQIPPSSAMGFPKYPELPLELRLQIIEHAVALFKGSKAKLSAIHSEWNGLVEPILFESIRITGAGKDLADLGNFCGKRQKLLKQIEINVQPRYHGWQNCHLEFISRLFHTMKDWSRVDRRPDDLIRLIIFVATGGLELGEDGSLIPIPRSSCDFQNLPELSVIGEMRLNQGRYETSVLHHSAMSCLYEKLPNLYKARLEFPCQSSSQEIINDSSSKYQYTGPLHPYLKKC